MKLLDICVIGSVLIVGLSRLPSPLRGLMVDLIAKSRLTMLSAVCQLLGFLDACDYFAGRFATVGPRHPRWVAVEVVVLLSCGLLFAPRSRAFLSLIFSNKRARIGSLDGYTLRREVRR
jgi:hypothetical protein